VVYVDDIVSKGDEERGIPDLKAYMQNSHTKDLGNL